MGNISESNNSVFQQTGGTQKVLARRLGTQEGELNDERSDRRQNGTQMGTPLQGSRMPSERGLLLNDRDREYTPKIMECRALEEILHVILCFSPTILYSIKKVFFQFISTIVENQELF
jgi:hypothetical protein